ncbi:site-specific integrase [Flavicella marina]|uniref:site-specific integrase n=1 Tax=Flavicella marina TaxID=1475951 RepID=UPI001264B084|nr:site-specific integrase [Flavicella marina]
MKATTTVSILIWVNTSRAKNGQADLFARVTVNQKRVNISLKRKIDIATWEKGRGCVRGNGAKARIINQYIDQVKSELFQAYQELRSEKELITAEAIKARFLGEEEQKYTLLEMFDYHNKKMGRKLHPVTLRHYLTSQKYLIEYIESEYKRSNLNLNKLSYAFLIGFENFLLSYKPKKGYSKIGNNTVMKHIQRLRKMVTMAFHMEWIDKDPFVKFKSSFDKSERDFLTERELGYIESYNSNSEKLMVVKDLFVFSCYTGISYIDIMNLTEQNLLLGIDGNIWIITKRHKTDTPVKVPILPKAQLILDKYKDHPRTAVSKTLLPVISNQKINSYLKEIASLSEINKRLTFHMARHTFATTVTLSNGVPIETVSKMLGHTKITTTQIYAKVIERKVSEDMGNLRSLLESKKDSYEANSKINIC